MNEKYVLKNPKTGNFIALDNYNGGIPYEVPIEKAKIWYNDHGAKEALAYKDLFEDGIDNGEDWELHKLLIWTKKIKKYK